MATHNRRVTPVIEEASPPCPHLVYPTAECVVGDEVLNIAPDAPYHTHFPWQRGDLNLQSGLSSSITAVMADLEAIWIYAIEHKLNIPQKEFKNYRCCVVIPALYCRDRVVHITRLLLDTLGFAACFVFQSSDKLQEVEDCRIKVSSILQSCLMSDGSRRFATPLKQMATHNRRVTPVIDEASPPCPHLVYPTAECVVGDEVLNIAPDAPYHTHFPWQRGDLNLQSGLSSSITAVMADLEAIWIYAIEHKLNIPQKEFKNYRCCVVIPALYCRDRVVHITRLLLDTLGFAACFVFQYQFPNLRVSLSSPFLRYWPALKLFSCHGIDSNISLNPYPQNCLVADLHIELLTGLWSSSYSQF
ncbi:hypothetical protein FHG87_014694 [Trinorchestia longiramus]|nr:hypothetical protein FHG87_014694 [Trinorchestia longiramus]